jgi:alanine racemase
MSFMRATRAIIHLDHFRGNIGLVRERVGPRTLICVPVKAGAYGHGALRMAGAALEAGADYLAVATVEEGAELREGGVAAPILLFSQVLPEEMPEALSLGLTPFVGDREGIEALDRAAEAVSRTPGGAAPGLAGEGPFPVHLKIDTGMGRLGCRPGEAAELAACIKSKKRLVLAGTATHLSVSDSPEPGDREYTRRQLALFREAAASIRAAGLEPGILHAANSGALVLHREAWLDMVRPGILLYGYSPAPGSPEEVPVQPVMELRTRIVFIKRVKKGEALSYGRTWTAPEDTFIATLPVGYGDGLPRRLGNKHRVLIRGKSYPLVGRICMDQCMVNLGDEGDIPRWEEATLFGPGFVTAADLAKKLDTIPYEITCGINKRVPRVYE